MGEREAHVMAMEVQRDYLARQRQFRAIDQAWLRTELALRR